MSEGIYTISIALQLAGAVLLIIKYWFLSANDQLEQLKNKRDREEGSGNVIMGDPLPSTTEFIKELWLSRIAFVYIAAGYIVGIWGDIANASKCTVAVMVFIITGILVIIGQKVSNVVGYTYKE